MKTTPHRTVQSSIHTVLAVMILFIIILAISNNS